MKYKLSQLLYILYMVRYNLNIKKMKDIFQHNMKYKLLLL